MSRIGKLPISIPAGVEVAVSDDTDVKVKGPKGELFLAVSDNIAVSVEENQVILKRASDSKEDKSVHGLYRTLVYNMIVGVSEGFKTMQEVVGVGYKATSNGQLLELSLGFSHDIAFVIPKEVKVTAETVKGKNPIITLESIDKELLGLVAAKIRSLRKPEPYKGKGIKFVGEELRRKEGKTAAAKS